MELTDIYNVDNITYESKKLSTSDICIRYYNDNDVNVSIIKGDNFRIHNSLTLTIEEWDEIFKLIKKCKKNYGKKSSK